MRPTGVHKALAALIAALHIGSTSGKEVAFPESFDGLSAGESVLSCAQFFFYSAELQIEGIRLTRNNQDFKKELRRHIQMRTTLLLYDIDKIPEARRELAKSAISTDVTETPSDVVSYCVAVYNELESKLTPQLRGKIAKYSESEVERMLSKHR